MFTILVIIIVYWLLLSLFAFYNVRKILKYFRNLPKIPIKDQWKGFIRTDLGKWNQRQILIGCFTRFPYHFTALAVWLINFLVLIPLCTFLGQGAKQNMIRFQRFYGNLAMRQVFNIVEQQNYQEYEINTPLVISNHVNWFDIWYIGISFLPLSIVSKASIRKTPIIGMIGNFFNAIYVQRTSDNQNQRDDVVKKITQRVQDFNQNKTKKPNERTYPLIIFPQGTTSNGRSILNFKHGAFNDLSPITMFTLNYKCKQFQMGMGDISQAQHVFITLCLKPTLQIKHKVMYPNDGETPDDYCKRCRQQMSQMTGFPKVESRYRDYLEYENQINEAIKKQREPKASKIS